ncbi:hypothetical protein IMSHALPRED_009384 [Imshaugia aleurites]|uniref:Uncharacterized protein n=1 Tax=Imshaugia aleurites TaxID=172621 RepID=A0A8H3IU13_9LECA|nr:hypothetical protein IMSHALPRED_009384 [Imshaugia aleurites]
MIKGIAIYDDIDNIPFEIISEAVNIRSFQPHQNIFILERIQYRNKGGLVHLSFIINWLAIYGDVNDSTPEVISVNSHACDIEAVDIRFFNHHRTVFILNKICHYNEGTLVYTVLIFNKIQQDVKHSLLIDPESDIASLGD